MNGQTILNIALSVITVYLAIRNFSMESRKESQRESAEMTEIRVQLNQVMSLLRELQKDVKTSIKDYRELSERVVIIETKLAECYRQLDEIKKELHNGIQQPQ